MKIFAPIGAESEQLILTVRRGRHGRIEPEDACIHVPLAPSRWYENVISTCGHVHFFRTPATVDDWCNRHLKPRGELIEIQSAWRLARRWYAGYLDDDWKPWSATEINSMLESCGLRGDFWHLPED